jgi:hypothetical protein
MVDASFQDDYTKYYEGTPAAIAAIGSKFKLHDSHVRQYSLVHRDDQYA